MTKKLDTIDIGDAFLDEVWHATAEAPRRFPGDHSYVFGLDALAAASQEVFGGIVAVKKKPATVAVQAPAVTKAPPAQVATTQSTTTQAQTTAQKNQAPTMSTSSVTSAAAHPKMGTTAPAVTAAQAATAKANLEAAQMKQAAAVTAAQTKKAKATLANQNAALRSATTAAANRLIAGGNKLSKRRANAGKGFVTAGQKLLAKATQIKGVVLGADAPRSPDRSPLPPSPLPTGVRKEKGPMEMASTLTYDMMVQVKQLLNAATVGGDMQDLGHTVLDLIDKQLKPAGLVDVAQSGETIVNRIKDFGAQLQQLLDDPKGVTESWTTETAGTIKNDAANWIQQAQAALSSGVATTVSTTAAPNDPGAFDPGAAGGGGADGGGDDGGGAGGGASGDPFADAEEESDPRFDNATEEGGGGDGGGEEEPSYGEAASVAKQYLDADENYDEGGAGSESSFDDFEEPHSRTAARKVLDAGEGYASVDDESMLDEHEEGVTLDQQLDETGETDHATNEYELPAEDEGQSTDEVTGYGEADHTDDPGTGLTDGGGGFSLSPEDAAKIAAAKKGKDKKGSAGGMGGGMPGMNYDAIFSSLAKDAGGISEAAGGKKVEKRSLVADILNPLNLISAAIEAGDEEGASALYGFGGLSRDQRAALALAATAKHDEEYRKRIQAYNTAQATPSLKIDPSTAKRIWMARKKYAALLKQKAALDAQAAAQAQADAQAVQVPPQPSVLGAYVFGLDVLGSKSEK